MLFSGFLSFFAYCVLIGYCFEKAELSSNLIQANMTTLDNQMHFLNVSSDYYTFNKTSSEFIRLNSIFFSLNEFSLENSLFCSYYYFGVKSECPAYKYKLVTTNISSDLITQLIEYNSYEIFLHQNKNLCQGQLTCLCIFCIFSFIPVFVAGIFKCHDHVEKRRIKKFYN
jgi:hypothetical protein